MYINAFLNIYNYPKVHEKKIKNKSQLNYIPCDTVCFSGLLPGKPKLYKNINDLTRTIDAEGKNVKVLHCKIKEIINAGNVKLEHSTVEGTIQTAKNLHAWDSTINNVHLTGKKAVATINDCIVRGIIKFEQENGTVNVISYHTWDSILDLKKQVLSMDKIQGKQVQLYKQPLFPGQYCTTRERYGWGQTESDGSI